MNRAGGKEKHPVKLSWSHDESVFNLMGRFDFQVERSNFIGGREVQNRSKDPIFIFKSEMGFVITILRCPKVRESVNPIPPSVAQATRFGS
jgi:hypothetical protein